MIQLREVLDAELVREVCERLETVTFEDGARTVPPEFRDAKRNLQLQFEPDEAAELERRILERVQASPLLRSWARPMRFTTPAFNRFDVGMLYGPHVDTPVAAGRPFLRRDVSLTIFLSEPDSYGGGELVVESPGAGRAAKLPAGDGLAYASAALHEVRPVTEGSRLACILWIQSFVADDEIRRILFDLDAAIDALRATGVDVGSRELLPLIRARQNLERRFVTT